QRPRGGRFGLPLRGGRALPRGRAGADACRARRGRLLAPARLRLLDGALGRRRPRRPPQLSRAARSRHPAPPGRGPDAEDQRAAAVCDRRGRHRRLRRRLRAGRGPPSALRVQQRHALRLHDRPDHRDPAGDDHDRRGHHAAVDALGTRDVRDRGPAAAAAGQRGVPARMRAPPHRATQSPRHRARQWPRHRASDRTGPPAGPPPGAVPGAPAAPSFRPEIHGLRGTAVLLVVLYHVWFDRVSGGVDVFLFISAFFLTGTFLRRMEAGAPLAPIAYWARTFKRLLPPAALVILSTLAAVLLLLPPTTWLTTLEDAAGSLLQVQNWVLIGRDTDYDAATGAATSTLQHFWSLSIQGQVFLLWPLLFALCAVVATRSRFSPRAVVAGVFGVTAVASCGCSLHSTGVQQPIAYFDSPARIWEFAAGALLALLPAATGPPRPGSPLARPWLRLVLGWAGLAVLVSTGALLEVQRMFPGWIALVPLTGAALVFLAGSTGSALGADRLLEHQGRPRQRDGPGVPGRVDGLRPGRRPAAGLAALRLPRGDQLRAVPGALAAAGHRAAGDRTGERRVRGGHGPDRPQHRARPSADPPGGHPDPAVGVGERLTVALGRGGGPGARARADSHRALPLLHRAGPGGRRAAGRGRQPGGAGPGSRFHPAPRCR